MGHHDHGQCAYDRLARVARDRPHRLASVDLSNRNAAVHGVGALYEDVNSARKFTVRRANEVRSVASDHVDEIGFART
jgi:hypothetical protein